MPFDRVYTVWDYYDGPREGIADFEGRPHHYRALSDHVPDDEIEVYELKPLDEEVFRLALEEVQIWERWLAALDAGLVTPETYPALKVDRARYEHISSLLARRFETLPGPGVLARGTFRPRPGHTSAERHQPLEVRWER